MGVLKILRDKTGKPMLSLKFKSKYIEKKVIQKLAPDKYRIILVSNIEFALNNKDFIEGTVVESNISGDLIGEKVRALLDEIKKLS